MGVSNNFKFSFMQNILSTWIISDGFAQFHIRIVKCVHVHRLLKI